MLGDMLTLEDVFSVMCMSMYVFVIGNEIIKITYFYKGSVVYPFVQFKTASKGQHLLSMEESI